MKIILPLFLILFSLPAFAAEAAKPVPAVAPASDMKERLALSAEFHKLRPLRDQIDKTIIALGEKLPDATRPQYLSDMAKTVNYKQAEDASIKAMAETFTLPELKAMIAYYSSPEGRSAADKMSDYQHKITPAIAKALDDAIAAIKYGKK